MLFLRKKIAYGKLVKTHLSLCGAKITRILRKRKKGEKEVLDSLMPGMLKDPLNGVSKNELSGKIRAFMHFSA